MLEQIIVSNVMKHVDKYSILSDCQQGFRARRSCKTQLVTLQHDLASTLDKGVQTDMVVLDFLRLLTEFRIAVYLGSYFTMASEGTSTSGSLHSFLAKPKEWLFRDVLQIVCLSLAGSRKAQYWGPCYSCYS